MAMRQIAAVLSELSMDLWDCEQHNLGGAAEFPCRPLSGHALSFLLLFRLVSTLGPLRSYRLRWFLLQRIPGFGNCFSCTMSSLSL